MMTFSFALVIGASAAVEFEAAFSSHMVIQRDAPIMLSGKGSPGADITISINAVEISARVSDDGSWSVEFPPMKAGGPHTFKAVENNESVTLNDVLCGDVWLCSGQSNMQMNLHEVIGGEEAMANAATRHEIRILTMPRGGADKPKMDFDARWQTPSAETVKDFSAVAWFFALHLKDDPTLADVPLGIVNSSFGGTAIEAWMPVDSFPDIPKDQISASMFGIPSGSLFNGMIAPLTGLRIKGAVWYQGESNSGQPEVYAKLLENLIDQWRTAFHQSELPFFIVQLPSFDGKMGGYDFSWLREAEARACGETENAWLAVTYDTTDGRDLHPLEKEEIGRRLSLLARREVYQSPVIASGPAFKDATIQDHRMRVTFDDRDGLTTRDGKPPVGFAIAGSDGDYRLAKATLTGATVVLENPAVPSPVTVRYAWGGLPSGNLVNRNGLPVAPFRTDSFAPEKISLQALPVIHRIETPNYQLTTGDNGQIVSLIIHGKQFLSNEPNGGTRIPDGWGPRNFPTTEVLGPHRLKTSDSIGSLEIAARDDAMEWILRNDRDSPIEFRVTLTPLAKVESLDSGAVISRDEVKLQITGVERVEGGASELVVKIQPHSTAVVRLQILQ